METVAGISKMLNKRNNILPGHSAKVHFPKFSVATNVHVPDFWAMGSFREMTESVYGFTYDPHTPTFLISGEDAVVGLGITEYPP